jgi:gliding motility-associated-like protein
MPLLLYWSVILFPFLSWEVAPGVMSTSSSAAEPPVQSIVTNSSYTVEELVEDIFATSTCDNISNISGIGVNRGIGYFENGNSSIGLDRGIILATGDIDNARGPNNATDQGSILYNQSGDPDLNIISTGIIKDAVGIEFDFTPLDSFVTFRYVFASEEYCEFVNSIYNDVFGFFISGPGINGPFSNNAANVALIPGSSTQVSINTINHLNNSGYYKHNELPEDLSQCNITNNPTNYYPFIEYDGFTQVLTASLKLYPCEVYHIRLVVADVGDSFYDSAVFLEAESFNIGGEVMLSANIGSTNIEPALEGCNDAFFQFERSDTEQLDFPLTVKYFVTDEGSATEGVDFVPLSGSITIPAGSPSVQLPVNVINDGIDEPIEDIQIKLDIPCACYTDSARMYIHDSPPVSIMLPDISVCENSTNQAQPTISSGTAPFSYQWSDGSEGSTLIIEPDGPTEVYVIVEDHCGNMDEDTASVFITTPPSAQLSGLDTLCEGDTAFFSLQLQGAPPWSVTYSIDGITQPVIEGIGQSSPFLPATTAGTYMLLGVTDAACSGEGTGEAFLEVLSIQADIDIEMASCHDSADGSLAVHLSGGMPPYHYSWQESLPNALEVSELFAGFYHLVVNDDTGCEKIFEMEVTAPTPIEAVIPECESLSNGPLELSASGGTPPYLYSTDNIIFSDQQLFTSLEAGQTYSLFVQDAAGCILEQAFLMPTTYEQMISLPASIEFSIGSIEHLSPQLNIPEAQIANIRWTPSTNLSCINCLQPELFVLGEEAYTIRIIDIYGCTEEATIQIKIDEKLDIYVPTAFSPNGDNVNDRFILYANTYQIKRIKKLAIFDRWGALLFQEQDIMPGDESAGWDGTSNGYLLDPGVYTYFAELTLYNNESTVVGGSVLLIR